MTNTILSAVREMLDRHWDVYEIAAKLRLDPAYVQAMIDIINNMV